MSNGELAMWVKCLRGLDRAGVRVVRMDRDTIHRLQRAVDPLMPASDAHEVLFYRRLRLLPRADEWTFNGVKIPWDSERA